MESSVLLVILALVKGEISASFAAAADMNACRVKMEQIKPTLARAGYKIIENRCVKSNLRFTSYRTRSSKNAPRQHYLIRFPDGGIKVMAKPDMASCEKAKNKPGNEKGYCTTSRQKIL